MLVVKLTYYPFFFIGGELAIASLPLFFNLCVIYDIYYNKYIYK